MTKFFNKKRKDIIVPSFFSGVDGSRTRVQRLIPCPSTIIDGLLEFPPMNGSHHPSTIGSFILRPGTQSFVTVVSCKDDALTPACRCAGKDKLHLGSYC